MITTITGIDNKVSWRDVVLYSSKFPNTEFGILFSQSRRGTPRYPDYNWLREFFHRTRYKELNLSAHLCGQFGRDLLSGSFTWQSTVPFDYRNFQRLQVNVNGDKLTLEQIDNVIKAVNDKYEIIIPTKNFDVYKKLEKYHEKGVRIGVLYDISGGKGISPENYQININTNIKTGVAGGIGYHNIFKVLEDIKTSVTKIDWVDWESNARDLNNNFDWSVVCKVLEEIKKYNE